MGSCANLQELNATVPVLDQQGRRFVQHEINVLPVIWRFSFCLCVKYLLYVLSLQFIYILNKFKGCSAVVPHISQCRPYMGEP
jgi:hypothetical protein